MKASQKANYALRAMLELARRETEPGSIRTAQVAAGADIPEKYLEAIMVELSKAGLIASRRGPDGGHRLARAPSQVTAEQIIVAVEGPIRLTTDSRPRARGARELSESTAELWEEVGAAMRHVLEGVTLEDMLKRAHARRGVLDFAI
jgi:Rrf2 family protein